MYTSIETLQAELPGDLKDLRVNTAKSILGITNPDEIRTFKRNLQLKYHPDKHLKISNRNALNALYIQVNQASDLYDQEQTMSFLIEVYREYSAQKKSNDLVYTKTQCIKYKSSIEIPKPFAEVEDFLRQEYKLNEKDIHEVQSIIKKYLTDLIEKIIDIHEPLTYELLFASNKLIKNDLFFLVDNIDHDDETMKETIEETIKQIESSEISYNDFDNDLKVKMDNTVVDNLVAKHFNVDKPFVTELAKALHDIRIQDNPNNQASTSNRFGIFKQDSLSSDMAADSRINLLSEDAPGV